MKRFRHVSTLIESIPLTPTVRHFVFSVPEDFFYHAGMFMSISFIGEAGVPVGRSYSLASIPTLKNKIEFCIKKVDEGKGSNHLFNMSPGDHLKVMGPMGNYFIKEDQLDKNITFVATGTGIAPFRGMIGDLLNRKDFVGNVRLVAGSRFQKEILYCDEFRKLESRHANFIYLPIVSRPGDNHHGDKGYVQQTLKEKIFPLLTDNEIFYLCGLKKMIMEVTTLLKSHGISKEQVFIEQYD
ncbi:MAG: hypothetical protein K0U66_00565 [Gammaproteobacteria bacterium]|nr:hypothetical protein [Gammaproteobacteria bacterium]